MDPLKAAIGAQQLVLRHYQTVIEGRLEAAVLVRLDPHGNILGEDVARAAEARPGRGYYADIHLAGIAVGAAVGGETDVWEVRGPDWDAQVTVHDPAGGGGPSRITCEIRRLSPAGLAFLTQHA